MQRMMSALMLMMLCCYIEIHQKNPPFGQIKSLVMCACTVQRVYYSPTRPIAISQLCVKGETKRVCV